MDTMHDWIKRLNLEPHPEGGYFREIWRSSLTLPADALPQQAARSAGTAIHFLLPAGVRSRWHRVASDELWIYQFGDTLRLSIRADAESAETQTHVGPDGAIQALVPAGMWQAADVIEGEHGYSLVCCVVVPGFEFADFEME